MRRQAFWSSQKNKQADRQLIREADSQRNAAGRPNLAQTESNGTNMSRLSNAAGKQRATINLR